MTAQNPKTTVVAHAPTHSVNHRLIWLGAGVLLLLAMGTRLLGLGYLDIWGDEVYSYIASTDLLPNLLRWDTIENQAHSPLPFLEIKVSRALLGKNNFATRLPAALYSIAAVLFLYGFLGRRLGWHIAFWAALLLCLNPFVIEWGREARMYSNWLFYTLLTLAVADSAIALARREPLLVKALDWRWWLLGLLFMFNHASNVHAVVVIAGLAGMLVLLALLELRRRPRVCAVILLGTLVAVGVYLSSWGLTGLGKLLHYMTANQIKPPALAHQAAPAVGLWDTIKNVSAMVAGYLPLPWAVLLWALALAGLLLLVYCRYGSLVLLLLATLLAPWIEFTTVSQEFGWFTGRYIFVSTLSLSIGLGTLAAWGWSLKTPSRWAFRTIVLAVLLASCTLWLPAWREVFLKPKMAVRQALQPILDHANATDALIFVPDWYASLHFYYSLEDKVHLIRPPEEARYCVLESDRNPNAATRIDPEDFRNWFVSPPAGANSPAGEFVRVPPVTWLFLVFNTDQLRYGLPDLNQKIAQLHRVLHAYRLDTPQHLAEIHAAADQPGVLTLTMRLSADKIDYLTATTGRRFR